ncbi:protoporphyrinogen oxidase [Metabacillus halosaccharovorans]|uniref:Coproporphyrinogen III oxidase n=1 Tax=Metabacillus halosaccharovorans TaxID=930124 RepID=A0ABT3DJE2_9BACI|nr:protoporphyrinogen oxidase [Metabacillus halosaccharovorans]MCV9887034.1 protoporphyrinogen oxidase [Metabacillus halosaccharovorans]
MKTVLVIGGGITGLAAMYYLQKYKNEQKLDLQLILVEQSKQLGGKIRSVHHDDFIMETGADSIVARNDGVMPLIKELQMEEEIVYNETGISYIYTNNELKPIPADSVFGIPTSIKSLFSSTLISPKGKMVALKDFFTKNKHFTSEDSVGEFLEAFLGKEIVENQISPVLSGVYSGKLNKLTMASTLPYLLEYKNQYGSIISGMSKNKAKFQSSSNKKFVSFKGGLSAIIDSIEKQLTDVNILTGVKSNNIKHIENTYEVTLDNHDTISADFVVLATPHDVAQKILNDHDLDHEFDKLRNSSLTSVYLGFDIPDDKLPANGTGFIVTENSDLHCDACTWTSRKWTHTSSKRKLLVRLFYKSSNSFYETLKNMSEQEMIQTALTDIEKSLGITAQPITVEVTNWDNLMPNYHLEHNLAVTSLSKKMSETFPNLFIAGASYFGVGIGACIKNGKQTAEKIVDFL